MEKKRKETKILCNTPRTKIKNCIGDTKHYLNIDKMKNKGKNLYHS